MHSESSIRRCCPRDVTGAAGPAHWTDWRLDFRRACQRHPLRCQRISFADRSRIAASSAGWEPAVRTNTIQLFAGRRWIRVGADGFSTGSLCRSPMMPASPDLCRPNRLSPCSRDAAGFGLIDATIGRVATSECKIAPSRKPAGSHDPRLATQSAPGFRRGSISRWPLSQITVKARAFRLTGQWRSADHSANANSNRPGDIHVANFSP